MTTVWGATATAACGKMVELKRTNAASRSVDDTLASNSNPRASTVMLTAPLVNCWGRGQMYG
jgi:hypothetical protein